MPIIGVFIIWLSFELGRVAMRVPFFHHPEEVALRFHLGLAVLAPIVLIGGLWSVAATTLAVIILGVLAMLSAIVGMGVAFRRNRSPQTSTEPLSTIEWVSVGTVAVASILAALAATAPATGWDAAVAHLSTPVAHVRADRIGLIPGNVYSAYPQFMHTLLTLDVGRGGIEITPMLSWTFSFVAIVAVGSLGYKTGGRIAGCIAAAMFATAPIFIAQSGTVAIDVPFTGFIASALLALAIWDESRTVRYLAIAGVIAGASCGIRHTGYLAAFLMFVWVVIQSRDSRVKSGVMFALAAFLASAPWWLRSWILVGNPMYPLLTSVFGDGGMPDVQVTAPLQHGTAQSAGIVNFLTFPWRIAMHPDEFDGWQASPGGLVVALGVVGVLWGGRSARWLGGFSLAGILTIYYVQRFARYLFPFIMPLHATAGLAAVRPGPLKRPIAALVVFSYIYGLGLAVGTTYFKWPVVFGLESREDYLTERVERYPAFQWINENLPEDATILTLDPRSYYIHRNSFQNLAAVAQLGGKSIEEQLEWMAARGIRYILIPDAYVASSPVFREWGISPLIDGWRGDARFRRVYNEDLPDVRGGGMEHVTILEVVWGDGDGAA